MDICIQRSLFRKRCYELIYSLVLLQVFYCMFCVEEKTCNRNFLNVSQPPFMLTIILDFRQMKRVELELYQHTIRCVITTMRQ